MKTECDFAFENALWPALMVDSSGIIRGRNTAAAHLFGPAVDGHPKMSSAIWSSDNEGSPEQFLVKWDRTPHPMSHLRFKCKGGGVQSFPTYICSRNHDGQKYFLLQLIPPAGDDAMTRPGERDHGIAAANGESIQKQKLDCALQLTRTVALDFNNVLTSILGHTSLILSKAPEDHPWRESLIEVEKAAEKAAAIAHDLAVFSRQEKDTRAVAAGDVNELLKRTIDALPKRAGVSVNWKFLPEAELNSVSCEEAKLQQALSKVLENSMEAFEKEGNVQIATRNLDLESPRQFGGIVLMPGRYVVVEVKDDGCGIPAETLLRVFEPFYTTKTGHRGLGLALVYGIVTNHGGTVTVSSQAGQGTTVTIYLPALQKVVKPRVFDSKDLGGNQTILMVDDEKSVLTLGQIILSSSGYNVITASNAQKALDVIHQDPNRIDLVITDLVMPQISGRELIQQIRLVAPKTRIICSSGYIRAPSPEESRAYLPKPFTSQELLRKVKEALSATEN